MTRDELKAVSALLSAIREKEEAAVYVGFGAHAPSHDCSQGSITVEIERDGIRERSEAVSLPDALSLCRAKVERAIEKREKEWAEKKASAEPTSIISMGEA